MTSPSGGDSGNGPALLDSDHWYSLQVAAFTRLSSAEKAVSQYRKKGCDAFYRHESAGSMGMWYRVYVGRYPTRQEAQKGADVLIQQKIAKASILRKLSADPVEVSTVGIDGAALSTGNLEQDEKGQSAYRLDADRQQASAADEQTASTDRASSLLAPAAAPGSAEPGLLDGQTPVIRLSLIDAVRYSLEGNRDIDVISYQPKQAQAQIEGAESVYDTRLFSDATIRRDPNLETSVTDIVTEDETRFRAGVRKPLKTGGTLSTYLELKDNNLNNAPLERTYKHIVAPTLELKQPLLSNIGSQKEKAAIKIANFKATISDAQFRQKVIEVTNRVIRVYWELYLYKELVSINRTNLDLAEEVYRREAERYARGISQQLEVARAKSNAQVRRSTWLGSVEEYRLTMDRLKLLLNSGPVNIDSDSQVLPVESPKTAPLQVDESETIARALSNRPEVLQARQQLMIREVDQDLAAHQKLPTLDFIGRYSVSGYGNDTNDAWDDVSINDDDAWEVGLQFEWAFGNRLAKSRYREKSLGRAQADAQLKRINDDIKLEVKQALQRLATLEAEIEANRLAMEAAEKVVEGEFARFDINETSNVELLRAQDLLAATSRGYARAVVDYNTAVHELARVQGDLPEGILLENVPR
jgi:HAE1 family hydrophobic/amphiphilic exporter-1